MSTHADLATTRIADPVANLSYSSGLLVEGYRVSPAHISAVGVHRSKKQSHCAGGHDGQKTVRCMSPIFAGQLYIEFSGQRYHIACARQQGLVELANGVTA